MKSERGQAAILVALALIVIAALVLGMMGNSRGMKEGADAIGEAVGDAIDTSTAETMDDIDWQVMNGTVMSFWVNKQRIYPNRHAQETHDVEADKATNCYNDHGIFYVQANRDGDWYFHCLEEDGRTVRTTIWKRVGSRFFMQSAYTKGDGAWSWSQIRAFFENTWGATKATFPGDGELWIDEAAAPYLP